MTFNAKAYWERRLGASCDLRGVGFARKGVAFNRWMYRHRAWHLSHVLRLLDLDPRGHSVLDVGSGTGFYVDFWLRRGATVTASDLTDASVQHLRRGFPTARVVGFDVSESVPEGIGEFDVVGVFDVMFHVVEPSRFKRALANLSAVTKPGGWLLLTDNFAGGTVVKRDHFAARNKETYLTTLADLGFETPRFYPVFFSLNSPSGIESKPFRFAASVSWECVTLPAPLAGSLVGFGLALVDRAVIPRMAHGPSTSLLVARRSA